MADVCAGVDGWHRYGRWSAHFYVNGQQQCNTTHDNFKGRALEPKRPVPAVLTRHGVPFGRVCARCLRLSKVKKR